MFSTFVWLIILRILEPIQVSDCFSENLMAEYPTYERLIKYFDCLVDNYILENSVFNPSNRI